MRRRSAGFTLVEVLVALLMMALLASLVWRALDGVLRARDDSRVSIERSARLTTVLAQWEQDLATLVDTEAVPPLAFDGQTLRMTRRAEGGVVLVAWSVRSGRWQRWTIPPIGRSGELQEAWLRSQQLQGTEPGHVELLQGVSDWQIYFARGGNWSNAQSSGDLETPPKAPVVQQPPSGTPPPGTSPGTPPGTQPGTAPGGTPPPATPPPPQVMREALPEAVRLVITLPAGKLTRDIALGPAGS